ncbi:MAG: di-heme oxidoredictase family protein [Microthrixaceae bacterium]
MRALRVGLIVGLFLVAGGFGLACSGRSGPSTPERAAQLPEGLTTEGAVSGSDLSGGAATVHNSGSNAFAQPIDGLSESDRRAFVVGNNFFNDNWVTAPASTVGRDGLGPVFNAQSCSSCHFKDGRGEPPSEEKPNAKGLLIRLSVPGEGEHGSPIGEPTYGTQFQDNGVTGVPAEGAVVIDLEAVTGKFADGTTYSLERPTYSFADLAYGPMHSTVLLSPRVGPAVFGSGLLEAIPESWVLGNADPDDADGDGISGRANMVWSPSANGVVLGRFGWKANVATVEEQVAGAFHGDIGLTSRLAPGQDCTASQSACRTAPNGGEPELDDKKLDRVTSYTRTLAVPARRDTAKASTKRGEKVFEKLGCSSCHMSSVKTGVAEPSQLSGQTIHPYSDLLLHDMGRGLADNRPDFLATGSEWRTPPLWGIGLTQTVNRHTRFLHDGRARNLTEAILWHGGEAESARNRFVALDRVDRGALLTFLNSL